MQTKQARYRDMGRSLSTLMLFAVATGLLAPGRSEAACHLNTPQALVCPDPIAAAEAWRVNGRDLTALDDHERLAAFREAGCGTFTSLADPGSPIFLKATADVPTKTGGVKVFYLRIVDRHAPAATWLAAGYLTGACDLATDQ